MWIFSILLIGVVLFVNGESDGKPSETQVQGVKRDNTDPLKDAEQVAGQAVLKLLDAKIGKKVQDAAKEVTDFLTSAIGSHASTRADLIRKDKQKEMSLLHLGIKNHIKKGVKKISDKPKLQKKKNGSFLVHFKIPYIVTPLGKKKKQKKKHHTNHKHHPHPHPHPHHYHHHKHKITHDKPPPIEVPKKPYHPVYHHAAVTTSAPSPYSQSTGYGTGYASTQVATMAPAGELTPCQGMCTNPCTPQLPQADNSCCCPDPNAGLSVPMPPPPPMAIIPNQVPAPPGMCPQICKRNCVAKCPSYCCTADKRNKVEKPIKTKPVKDEKTTQEAETEEKRKKVVENEDDQETSQDQREEGSANEAANDEDSVE